MATGKNQETTRQQTFSVRFAEDYKQSTGIIATYTAKASDLSEAITAARKWSPNGVIVSAMAFREQETKEQ